MVSQPRKPKTRLCLLLGAAIVLFHAVALTTPVFAAKAEQHPLDTSYSAPKATKVQSKTHIHKFAKTKKTDKKKEKTAHHKTPTIKKDTSLVDTTFEATKMDAGSLKNSIAGLWDNVVQFGKYEAPVLQSEIDQVLRNELIGLLEIQGGRNLQQQQQDEEQQDQNSDVEVILTRKHRRAAKHKSRHIKRNTRGYLERVDDGHPRKYRHRKGPGKLRGGKRHRKNRHVGHRVPAPPAITVQPAMPSPHPVPPDDDDDENLKSPSTPEAPDVEDFPRPAIVVSPAEPKDTLPDPTSLPDDDDGPDDDPLDSPSTPNENNDDSDDVIASPPVTEMPKGPAPAPVARETGPKSRVVAGPVPAPMAGTPPPVAEAPIPPLPKQQQQQQQQSNAPVANPLPLAPTAPKQMVPPKPNLLMPVAEPDDDEEEDDDDEEGDDEQDDEKTPNDSALVDDEGRDKEDGSIEAGKGMDVDEADEDEDEDDGDEGEDEKGDIEEEDKKKTQNDREEGGEKRKVMMPVLQKRQVLVQAVKTDKLEASLRAQVVPDAKPIDAKTELKEDQKTEKKEAKKEEEVAAAATATVADDKKEDKSQGNFARVEKSKRYPKEQPVMEPAKEQEPVTAAAVEKAKEKREKKKKKNHKNNKDDLLLGAQQYQNTMTDYNTKEIVFADGGADGQKKKKNKMKKKDKKDREAEEEAQLDKNGLKDDIIQPLVHEPQGDEIDQPVKAAKVHKKHEKHNNNEKQDALEPMADVVEDAPLQDQPTFEVFKGHNNDNSEKEDKKKKKDKHDNEDKGNQKDMDNKDQGNNALPPPPSPPPPPPLPAPAQDNNNNKPAPKGQQGNAPQVPPAGMSPDRNTKAGGGTDYDTVPMFGPAQLDLVSEAVKLCSGWRAHATAVIAVVFVNML